jgi:3-deoxy-D-manno-octulosonate 8-phosphate phosphatase (KDO 8-P phosphatase)
VNGIDPGLARGIRLVVLDVDGVFTDNELFVGEAQGERVELKRFNVQDGVGVHLLRFAGIPVAILSGRVSAATTHRMRELGVTDVIQDPTASKLPRMLALLEEKGIGWGEVLYVGDDLPDVPVMRRVGIPVSVANGVAEVKAVASHVTERVGGDGAVREVIEALLKARGEWENVLAGYYRERGGDAT